MLRIEKDKNNLLLEAKCMTFSEVQGAKKEMEFMATTSRTANHILRDVLLMKAATKVWYSFSGCCTSSCSALTVAEEIEAGYAWKLGIFYLLS